MKVRANEVVLESGGGCGKWVCLMREKKDSGGYAYSAVFEQGDTAHPHRRTRGFVLKTNTCKEARMLCEMLCKTVTGAEMR